MCAQMLRSFGEGRMFFTAVFHPDDDKQNVILAGCADKKIHQWDADTGDLVQARSLLLCRSLSPSQPFPGQHPVVVAAGGKALGSGIR